MRLELVDAICELLAIVLVALVAAVPVVDTVTLVVTVVVFVTAISPYEAARIAAATINAATSIATATLVDAPGGWLLMVACLL